MRLVHTNLHISLHAGDWINQLFTHQACVFEYQAQYKKANSILTTIIKEALSKCHISKGLYQAFSKFQLQKYAKQS
jgi:hypothetical protein